MKMTDFLTDQTLKILTPMPMMPTDTISGVNATYEDFFDEKSEDYKKEVNEAI
jgi:hypothetical protein